MWRQVGYGTEEAHRDIEVDEGPLDIEAVEQTDAAADEYILQGYDPLPTCLRTRCRHCSTIRWLTVRASTSLPSVLEPRIVLALSILYDVAALLTDS